MIDFRYHLVSLISVFLALAVGIALGAGPLEESIGDTLTGQVDQLRAEKDDLRAQVEQLSGELDDSEAALTALGPSVLDGTLGGRRVALVVLDEVDQSVVEQISRSVGQAGGTVSAVATVTQAWTDPTRSTFRQSLAATMVTYLDTVPPADAGTDTELAEALAQALTTPEPTDPDVLSEHAQVLLDLFGGDSGLVTFSDTVTAPADAIVVVAGPISADEPVATPTPDSTATSDVPQDGTSASATATAEATATASESASDTEVEAQVAAWSEIALASQRRSDGAVVVTGTVSDPGLVLSIRTDADLSGQLSTVDSVLTPAGGIAVPLALTNRISGTVGQYGFGPDASDPIPPRVELPPIERTPEVVEEPTPSDTQPTEGADASTGQG
ncbi:copper transporter [Actinotalea sp. M2MS4P-6]|uniref:copper transporter n=1 Tax=Actinotalea sp. M2MS4P-6 TaxID=2983762 RepID=UPI0021E4AEC5|nr:copper transporter [Actinotalea sp. M2MS4P-6]MCV2393364.1 copper transporter [Actinotalea sp. M2MS4P-6]